MIKLRISSRDGVRDLETSDERILIGRAEDCPIKVDERNISRHHTAIEKFDGGYRVVDLESRNGTYLNASRIQNATLSKGDAIKVGEVYIYVEQVPELKGESQVELKSVPVAEKEEVRNKIDDMKKMRAAELRRGSVSRFLSTAVTAVSIIILVGGICVGIVVVMKMGWEEKAPKPETAQKTPAPAPHDDGLTPYQAEALDLLRRVESEADVADLPSPVHIAKVVDLQSRYAHLFEGSRTASEGQTLKDPFQRVIEEMTSKRVMALEASFKEAQGQVDTALIAGQYAEATDALRRFHEKTGGGHEDQGRLLQSINDAAKTEYEQLMEQIALMKKYKHYGDVAALCNRSMDRFKGTPYRIDIAQELDLAVKRAEYQVAEHQLRLEVHKQYPDLVIGPGYELEEGQSRIGIGFGLPIPIINTNREGIARARGARLAVRAEYEAELERLLHHVAQAEQQLNAAAAQRAYVRDELAPLVDQQVGDAKRYADLGEFDALVQLDALSRRHEARLQVLDSTLQLALALEELNELLGPTFKPAPKETDHE